MAGIVFPNGPTDHPELPNNIDGTDEADRVTAGPEDDDISGQGGNDTITGNSDNDTVQGGDGNDSLSGGESGDDSVDGGDGNDVIFESNGHDTLLGGDGADTIVVHDSSLANGGAGDDTIHLGTTELIALGATVGSNKLFGGEGNDLLEIGNLVAFATSFNAVAAGFERIDAPVAFDGTDANNFLNFSGLVLVGAGGLSISGGGGLDILTGVDDLFGGDLLSGDGGNDKLDGGSGGDTLLGGADADTLAGGDGNDELTGGERDQSDFDVVQGDAGNDLIHMHGKAAVTGGTGDDTISVSDAIVRPLAVEGDQFVPNVNSGIDTLIVGNNTVFATGEFDFRAQHLDVLIAEAPISGDGGANKLIFGSARVEGATPVLFFGNAGNDTIQGTAVDDVIHGGADNDRLEGLQGENQLFGEDGNDLLIAGSLADTLDGGAGSDVVRGGDGRDIISDFGRATVDAGKGNDTVTLKSGLIDTAEVIGGEGTDTLFSTFDTSFLVFLNKTQTFEFGAGAFFGTDGANSLNFTGMARTTGQIFNVFAGNGNDAVTASAGGMRVDCEDGNDTATLTGSGDALNGGAGNDLLLDFGTTGTVSGGDGNDTASGRGGSRLDGGNGQDRLEYDWIDHPVARLAAGHAGIHINLGITAQQNTGVGALTISNIEEVGGSSFDDSIAGSAANNTLLGRAGDDLLAGRQGDDRLNGGIGNDTASYAQAAAGVTVSLLTNNAQNTGEGLDTLVAVENVTGSGSADRLTGAADANLLAGGAGNDTLAGSLGNDTLTGGNGRDDLAGGLGADDFRYETIADSRAAAGRNDVIHDFKTGADTLDVAALDAMAGHAGNDIFRFIAQAAFKAEGQIRVFQQGTSAIVEFNTAGAGGAELRLELAHVIATAVTAGDFDL